MGEGGQQLQPVSESVHDLVWITKVSLLKTHQSKSGQAPKELTERQNWIQDKFRQTSAGRNSVNHQTSSPHREG